MIRDPRKPHLQLLGILEQSVSCVDASAAAQSPLTSAPTQQQQQAANTVHSVLGALRNFCVSATVRTELLASCEKRLVATAMRYVRHSNMDVKAKALSVLRLLVRSCSDKSGGALDDVFSSSADGDFLATLEQVLDTKACVEHPSVAGESSRLVCYLPVAAKSEKRMRLLGTGHVRLVHAVCSQLASEHWVMVNEALLALNVLTVVDYASCVDALRTSVVDERMRALFGEQRQATMPVEITLNLMRLFKFLYERRESTDIAELNDFIAKLYKCIFCCRRLFQRRTIECLLGPVPQARRRHEHEQECSAVVKHSTAHRGSREPADRLVTGIEHRELYYMRVNYYYYYYYRIYLTTKI